MKTIVVMAQFEVTFKKNLTEKQFELLESGKQPLDQLVDEAEAYQMLRTDGRCELEWDFDKPKGIKGAKAATGRTEGVLTKPRKKGSR